jgi:hypothetical protein
VVATAGLHTCKFGSCEKMITIQGETVRLLHTRTEYALIDPKHLTNLRTEDMKYTPIRHTE